MKHITEELFKLQDLKYRDFHSRLMPNIDKELIIGVRMPHVRDLAKRLYKENPHIATQFIKEVPHKYYEENNLHAMFISLISKDPSEVLKMVDDFLPYVDNWATCDSLSPKCLKKNLPAVRSSIEKWLEGPEVYRTRFALVSFIDFFLDEAFQPADLQRIAQIRSDEYYINMAIAWYFSFALIKQYDAAIPLFQDKTLDAWIHNKSIQKAIESYRIDEKTKEYLRSLKVSHKKADNC